MTETSNAVAFDRLGQESYVALTTYRRDGTPVTTPVWAAPSAGRLYVYTPGRTGKAKRVRNDGHVTLTPCDRRGKKHGDAVHGQATVLGPDRIADVRAIMRAQYGWKFLLFSRIMAPLLSRTTRLGGDPVGIEIRPAD